jgi:hypothetical protein
VPGSAAVRDRPDDLLSHSLSAAGKTRIIRQLLSSYQTQALGLEIIGGQCAQDSFSAMAASK